jgi:ABC-type polysaccharide/polyol phosphate transport system ATPase subunit
VPKRHLRTSFRNMRPILSVQELSKRYTLRPAQASNYVSLRDVVSKKAASLVRRGDEKKAEEFWALNEISFEIAAGDRLGVIGRNGAGKSTLLKVLSQITEPTSGRICIGGRVASLLEVGTGFHPELSGRENIFLNGAILGMSRTEILSKFDEIVQFAEIEQFLDTPVKRFSSGMYMRLAFAVSAHLSAEILIVDEVLAVGDAQFQKKCLDKMRDISEGQGRTILFVSHNMGAVRTICNRCIFLDKGRIVESGRTDDVLPHYFGSGQVVSHQGIKVSIQPEHDSGEWVPGSFLGVELSWDVGRFRPGWHADIACYTLEGTKVFAFQSDTLPGFDSSTTRANGVLFRVVNPGLFDQPLRLDFGIKPDSFQPYSLVVENIASLNPSNKTIEFNRLTDVLLVPQVDLRTICV